MRTVGPVEFWDTLGEILRPGRCALLVVDMQNDFCSPDGHFARNGQNVTAIHDMVPRLAQFLEGARQVGIPVVYVQQTTLSNYASDSPAWMYYKTRGSRPPADFAMDGSWGHQIIRELAPDKGELVVRKHRPTAFHMTDLDLVLRNMRVETVVATGCVTEGCLLATVRDASFHDYYVVVVEDCVQSVNQEQHEIALRMMCAKYDVLTSGQVLEFWSSARASGR